MPASAIPPIQIALFDDHALFRQGMRYILQALPFVESVVETGDLPTLLLWCRARLPDVLLLDLQMPGMDGPEVAKTLLQEFPDLKIIVLSMFSADKYMLQMIKLGARSYLPKDADEQQLRLALEEVLTVGQHFTPAISRALLRGVQQPTRPAADRPGAGFSDLVQLTAREREVLRLIGQGRTAAEIAEQLFISRRTVEGHWQHLLDKTQAANAAGLVSYAARHGLLDA